MSFFQCFVWLSFLLVSMSIPANAHRDGNNGEEAGARLINQDVYLTRLGLGEDHRFYQHRESKDDHDEDLVRYCVQANARHENHPESTSTVLYCGKADWDRLGQWSKYKLLLFGKLPRQPQGLFGRRLLIARHKGECMPVDRWEIDVLLFFIDAKYISGAFDRIKKIMNLEKIPPQDILVASENEVLNFSGKTAEFLRKGIGAAFENMGSGRLRHYKWAHRYVIDGGLPNRGFIKAQGTDRLDEFSTQVRGFGRVIGRCPKRPPVAPPEEKKVTSEYGDTCLTTDGNPLCSNPGSAMRRQFQQLRQILNYLNAVARAAPREDRENIDRTKRAIAKLVGDIAAGSAKHQILVAEANGILCCGIAAEFVQKILGSGDRWLQEAVEQGSDDAFEQAITAYEMVSLVLAPQNYGEKFSKNWDMGLASYFRALVSQLVWTSRDGSGSEELAPARRALAHTILEHFDTLNADGANVVRKAIADTFGTYIPIRLDTEESEEAREERIQDLLRAFQMQRRE